MYDINWELALGGAVAALLFDLLGKVLDRYYKQNATMVQALMFATPASLIFGLVDPEALNLKDGTRWARATVVASTLYTGCACVAALGMEYNSRSAIATAACVVLAWAVGAWLTMKVPL